MTLCDLHDINVMQHLTVNNETYVTTMTYDLPTTIIFHKAAFTVSYHLLYDPLLGGGDEEATL